MRHLEPVRIGLLAAGALLALPAGASAQGSAVYTQSACMNARNGAGIAAPCSDGSAVYYNPAALARQNGAVSLGVTLIEQSGSFVYDTTAVEIERAPHSMAVPHGWATWRPSERIGIGFGVWAPYGLSIDWPTCASDEPGCADNFEGRFVGYDQSMRGLYFQPTVAYDLIPGRLALGVGVDVVKGDVEIHRRLDLSEQSFGPLQFAQLGIPHQTDFADVKLTADAWGVTGHVGAHVTITPSFSFGARYMHSVELAFDGDADFSQVRTGLIVGPLGAAIPAGTNLDDFLVAQGVFEEGSPASDQTFAATIVLPAQAVAGIAFQPAPDIRLMADYQWTQWSSWDAVPVDFEVAPDEQLIFDYQDASTYRVGADYAFSDRITLHGGFTLADAAATDAAVSPFLPDSRRAFYSGGISFRVGERLQVDAFGMTANAADRRGRVVNRTSFDQTADQLNEGIYVSSGQLFGVTATYHLGGPR